MRGRFADADAALVVTMAVAAQTTGTPRPLVPGQKVPPRVVQAQRFLAQRGWSATQPPGAYRRFAWRTLRAQAARRRRVDLAAARADCGFVAELRPGHRAGLGAGAGPRGSDRQSVSTWEPPAAGSGCRRMRARRNASNMVFTPLTDALAALSGAQDASISIGALTVQPGGTGVILAGTGDPNDALDSYYGAGILRSADGGNTWSLIPIDSGPDVQLCRGGICGLCLEHGESATGGGRGFAGV